MVEPAARVGGGDAVEGGKESGFERVAGARRGGPQRIFELGPAGFDWRQIGRVARQIKQLEPGRGQSALDLLWLVRGQIIHQHGGARVTAAQFGDQHFLQEGDKDPRRGGCREAHGGDHPLARERPQDAQPPPATRGRTVCALAARGTGIEAGHCRGDAGLVDKDQRLGVKLPDLLAEDGSLRLNVGAIPFAGV